MGKRPKMKEEWVSLVERLALQPAYYMSGVQKILRDVSWEVNGKALFDKSLSLSDFGYAEKGNKMKALRRHYLDPEKVQYVRHMIQTKYDQRSYGSAGFPLTGEVKKWTKQDFCMQACTITHYPSGGLKISVFYRTTEVIKKFGADLIFLRDIVLPRFDRIKWIESVTFHLSNVTVHPMFFTTFLSHHPLPIALLKRIAEKDPRFHQGIIKWMTKYMLEGETSWVQKFSQARQTHAAMLRLMDDKKRKRLIRYIRDVGGSS